MSTAPPASTRSGEIRRPVRLVVVDDHALVREGTAELLDRDPDLAVVGQAGSGEEAIALVRELRPDVVLLDVALPGMNGIEVARALRTLGSDVRVLILSAYDDHAYLIEALDAGVAGYLLKTVSGRELVDAVRTVAGGAMVLGEPVSRHLTGHWQTDSAAPSSELTARESDVLALVARGWSNKRIASELGLGLRTVEGHVSNLLAKLALSSRTELALYAVDHHLVPSRPSG